MGDALAYACMVDIRKGSAVICHFSVEFLPSLLKFQPHC